MSPKWPGDRRRRSRGPSAPRSGRTHGGHSGSPGNTREDVERLVPSGAGHQAVMKEDDRRSLALGLVPEPAAAGGVHEAGGGFSGGGGGEQEEQGEQELG